MRGSGQVAVAFFGDGAANQGVLHESLNLAAIWKLPVIYVCENNGFAESTPAAYATSVPDVAIRAAAYGIPGVIADGADVLDVYRGGARGGRSAPGRARGPTLLEVKTLPLHGPFRGRPRPLPRRRGPRADTGARRRSRRCASGSSRTDRHDEGELDALQPEIEAAVSHAVEFARASPFPDPAELERYVYPEPLAARGVA